MMTLNKSDDNTPTRAALMSQRSVLLKEDRMLLAMARDTRVTISKVESGEMTATPRAMEIARESVETLTRRRCELSVIQARVMRELDRMISRPLVPMAAA